MTQDEVYIRTPAISDLEDIVHLNRISLPENYAVAYFIDLIKTWKESSCVAEIDNKVIGYILMRIEGSSSAPWKFKSRTRGHIISVAVHPDVRRRGIGTKMMEFVLERINSVDTVREVTLEVRQSNVAAINLYRQLNFVSDKIISKYYSDGEDAVLMKYYLK